MPERFSHTVIREEIRRGRISRVKPPRYMDMVASLFMFIWALKIATMPGNLSNVHTLVDVFNWLPPYLRHNYVWVLLAVFIGSAQAITGAFDLPSFNGPYQYARRFFAAVAAAFWVGFSISIFQADQNATGTATYLFGFLVNVVVAWRKY